MFVMETGLEMSVSSACRSDFYRKVLKAFVRSYGYGMGLTENSSQLGIVSWFSGLPYWNIFSTRGSKDLQV